MEFLLPEAPNKPNMKLGTYAETKGSGKAVGGVSGDRHAERFLRKRPLCGITCHAILCPRSLELLCYVLRIAISPSFAAI